MSESVTFIECQLPGDEARLHIVRGDEKAVAHVHKQIAACDAIRFGKLQEGSSVRATYTKQLDNLPIDSNRLVSISEGYITNPDHTILQQYGALLCAENIAVSWLLQRQ